MAVTLPLVLVLIDYYLDKQYNFKSLINKIPYLIISLIFGIIAIIAQKEGKAIGEITTTNLFQNILVAFHGIWFYIYKMFIPIHLSAFYPYPDIKNHGIPLMFYIAPLIVITISIIIFYYSKYNKLFLFGFLFFIINIIQVSQIIPVGSAIAADRYFYLSSIGLFFILAFFFNKIYNINKSIFVFLTIIITLILSVITYQRTKIWQNSLALWESVLSEYPEYPGAAVAYNNCGMAYRRLNNMDKAFYYVEKALSLDSTYALAYKNYGGLFGKTGDYEKALYYLLKAQKYDTTDAGTYNNLGNVYAIKQDYSLAKYYFHKAISIDPKDDGSWQNLATVYLNLNNYDSAIICYNKALEINPDNIEIRNYVNKLSTSHNIKR